METAEAERGRGVGKADLLLSTCEPFSDKPMELSRWELEEMEEIPICLESGKGLEKAPEMVLTFALRPLQKQVVGRGEKNDSILGRG